MVAVLAAGTVTMTGGVAEAKPHPAAAWDFNGDGFKDLVVGIPTYRFPDADHPAVGAIGVGYGSSAGPGELRIYTGPGSVNTGGLWQGYGRVLTSGDFDGDGYADLAVGGVDDAKGRGSVYLHWGGPSGLARSAVRLWGPRRVDWSKFGFAIAAGDFDHDGYSDLFASEVYGGHAWVYRGGREFRKKHKPAALPVWDKKAYIRSAAAGDFDGDGRDDLVLSWFRRKDLSTKTPDRLSVYAGTKKGLKAHATTKVPPSAGLLAVGDLTGDRRADIALAATTGRVLVWRGTKKGFARAAKPWSAAGSAQAVAITGGRLALGSQRVGEIISYALTASGKLSARAVYHPLGINPGQGYGTSIAFRDFNDDGLPDVAAGIPYLSYDYSPDGQVALNRAVDLTFGAGRLSQRQYQLTPIHGASLSQLALN
jgi:hypothetical protein